MEPLLGGLIGAIVGGWLHGVGGAIAGALLGYLLMRVFRLEKRLDEQNERLKAMHVLFEEGHYGERIRTLQQRLLRLEGGRPADVVEAQAAPDVACAPSVQRPEDAAPCTAEVALQAWAVSPIPLSFNPDVVHEETPPGQSFPDEDSRRPAWLTKLLSGNPLAKVGAILLFFGIASGFKLAVEHGWFPLPLRVLLTASVAITMIVFGWQQHQDRPRFADALQGGGFAILYLIVFFMLSRWGWIVPAQAFAAFVVLAGACIALALLQSTQVLAILGSAGGFLAPVLASTEQGSHILLFSFYLLLGVTMVAASAWRGWRVLPITGMFFTFAIGLTWAWKNYVPANYVSTQIFLVAFFLLYGLWPWLVRWRFALVAQDSPLTFGVPLAVLALQYSLVHLWRYGFATSAALMGVFYLLLWSGIRRSTDWLPTAFLGLGISLLTVAVPFAFDVVPSAALWAVEGTAGLAVARRYRSRLGVLAGAGLQVLAGVYLLTELATMVSSRPVMNTVFLSAVLIAVSGVISAGLLARTSEPVLKMQAALVRGLLVWTLLWWFGASWREIDSFVTDSHSRQMAMLLHWAATVLLLELAGKVLAWLDLRRSVSVLNLLLLPALLHVWHVFGHVFAGNAGLAWCVALVAGWWVRRRQDEEAADSPALSHVLLFGVTLAALAGEVIWRGQELLPMSRFGHYLFVLPVFSVALLFCWRWPGWPVARWPDIYVRGLSPSMAWLVLLVSVWLNAVLDGAMGMMPYQPLLSLFDMLQMLALYAVWRWTRDQSVKAENYALWLASFVWLTMLPARVATSWFGAGFGMRSLLDSPEAATGLALVWTMMALGLMWFAQRYVSRIRWFASFSLLCAVGAKLLLIDLRNVGTMAWTISLIGVALLVLVASYIAPAPPKEENRLDSKQE